VFTAIVIAAIVIAAIILIVEGSTISRVAEREHGMVERVQFHVLNGGRAKGKIVLAHL